MISEDTKLQAAVLPCPLCAGEAKLRHNRREAGYQRTRYWVKCDDLDCGCTLDSVDDPTEAVRRWNRRSGQPGLIITRVVGSVTRAATATKAAATSARL